LSCCCAWHAPSIPVKVYTLASFADCNFVSGNAVCSVLQQAAKKEGSNQYGTRTGGMAVDYGDRAAAFE